MLVEQRKSVRREVNIPAKIDPGKGAKLHDCVVLNISDGGALIASKAPEKMPDEFTVVMSPTGFPFRRCRVAWRTSDRIGVEFADQWNRRHQPHDAQDAEEMVSTSEPVDG